MIHALGLLPLLLGCGPEDVPKDPAPPLGIILKEDGQLYAGISRIDLSPVNYETYTDLNGNHSFDGCLTNPAADRGGCDEPYDDLNGDNYFDAAWIAGFGSGRAALGTHDPITATALVLSLDGEYVAIVSVDALGVLENRVRDARDLLEAAGFDRDRIVISSTHSHQAPDTAGIYGISEDLVSGIYTPFIESLAPGIFDAVSTAASVMEPVTPRQGAMFLSDWDARLNGAPFGGTNPNPHVIGGINDIRDPLIPGDQLLAIALDGADGRVATVVSASGHPEVVGDENDYLSADYPGYLRDWIERRSSGTAMFLSGALGGMQSALGSSLPLVDADGAAVLDEAGEQAWISESGFAFAENYGVLLGLATEAALTDATAWDAIRVSHAEFLIPVDNLSFKLAFQTSLLDTPDDYIVQNSDCPGYGSDADLFGCVPGGVWMLELGPVTFGSIPGELMPELFWGVPDEPAMADSSLRSTDRRWPQWSETCDDVPWETCKGDDRVGECDCLHSHAAPYVISDDGIPPIVDMLPGTFHAPIGIANAYCGYVVPEPDFSTFVSVFTDDGDHYEETNSCSRAFAGLVQEAFVEVTGG